MALALLLAFLYVADPPLQRRQLTLLRREPYALGSRHRRGPRAFLTTP